MALDPAPAVASPKTRYTVTLLLGTSWTVPTGCLYVNATLFGGGGGGGANVNVGAGTPGFGGQIISTSVTTAPGANISFAIGAGGAGGAGGGNNDGSPGGTTTFTGATSAVGGLAGRGYTGGTVPTNNAGINANNGGQWLQSATGGVGGAGKIELEYWV